MNTNIIFKAKFFAKDSKKDRDYYSQGKYISYISRKNTLPIFNFDGKILETSQINNQIKKRKSIFWDTIFSFKNEFVQNLDFLDGKVVAKILKHPLEKFFQANWLDPKKMNVFFAIHNDKNNHYDVHVAFFENEPNFLKTNKKTKKVNFGFRNKGNLAGTDFINFKKLKRDIFLEIEDAIDYQKFLNGRNEICDDLKIRLQNLDKQIKHAKIQLLINEFGSDPKYLNKQKMYYNNLNLRQKQIVNNVVFDLISDNQNLKTKYQELINLSFQIVDQENEINDQFKIKTRSQFFENNIWSKFGLIPRLANIVLNTTNQYLKDKHLLQKSYEQNSKKYLWQKNKSKNWNNQNIKKFKKFRNKQDQSFLKIISQIDRVFWNHDRKIQHAIFEHQKMIKGGPTM